VARTQTIVQLSDAVPRPSPTSADHGEIARDGALRVMRLLDAEERAAGYEPW
jgi:hypothetical protein